MDIAKNEILARLKAASDRRGKVELEKPDFTSPVYLPLDKNLIDEFRGKIELVSGKLIVTDTIDLAVEALRNLIQDNKWENVFCKDDLLKGHLSGKIVFSSEEDKFLQLRVGITRCECLVAHLGSVIVSSGQPSGRQMNVYPEIHIIFAYEGQLVDYLETGLEQIRQKYDGNLPSLITVITGPSRTADIEKTLVMGMHGPKSFYVILSKQPF